MLRLHIAAIALAALPFAIARPNVYYYTPRVPSFNPLAALDKRDASCAASGYKDCPDGSCATPGAVCCGGESPRPCPPCHTHR